MKRRGWKLALSVALGLFLASHATLACATDLPIPDRAHYVFQKVGEDVGMATITPQSMAQDRQGFIWIGTQSGLLRYDGAHVLRFGPEQGVPSNDVQQVIEAPDGKIWVATYRGVAIGESGRFRALGLPPGAANLNSHQPLAADAQGHIYVAASSGLWVLSASDPFSNSSQNNLWTVAKGIPGKEVDAVSSAQDGTVWFLSGGRVGHIGKDQRISLLPQGCGIPNEPLVAVIEDGRHQLWVRTSRHLVRLDLRQGPIAGRFVDAGTLPPANDIGAPILDRQGNLMVPTVAGLYLDHYGQWRIVDKHWGTANNAIVSALEDREGATWLGLGGNGIQRWQGEKSWSGWTDAEGLPDNVVWAETRDLQQRLWIGTNNGVAMWDEDAHRFRTWNQGNGLNGSTARQLAVADDGSIWVQCHPGGLTRFDPTTLRPEKVPIPLNEINLTRRGLGGHIWILGDHRLLALRFPGKPYVFEDVKVPQEILDGVTDFALTPDGRGVWMSGPGGIARFDGKSWEHFDSRNGLRSDAVTQVVPTRLNDVWVRYQDALGITRLRFDGQSVQVEHFGVQQGLQSDDVYMLGLDRQGSIWAGGGFGVARISPQGHVRRYSHADGLIWDDQSEGGFFAEPDGTALLGTSGGLARFDPNSEDALLPPPPKVVIASAQLGGRERATEKRPEASHRENTLRAEFSVLTFRDPAHTRCWYRLNGLENEFTETNIREVRYPALPPGQYALEVSCESAAGVKSEMARFEFSVMSAWWQSWWARGLMMLLAGLGLYGVVWFRTYALERDRHRLEQAVGERNRELAHANRELREASLTDPLTGARNRRFFHNMIEADVSQTLRSYTAEGGRDGDRNRDLMFYLIDVDHFKQINDRNGHDAGDELLVEMTRRLKTAIRQSDELVRWGGEEFLVVSRYTDRSEAAALAKRVLNAIGTHPYTIKGATATEFRTCSIGWAALPWFRSAPGAVGYETVLELADRALYQAKQSGRNRAVGFMAVAGQSPAAGDDAVTGYLSADSLQKQEILTPGPQPESEARSTSSGAG